MLRTSYLQKEGGAQQQHKCLGSQPERRPGRMVGLIFYGLMDNRYPCKADVPSFGTKDSTP